jgi:parallel beta-helix repeat protein
VNGDDTNATPTTGLCRAGTASAVAGTGSPWTWSCRGASGITQCWATLPAYYVSPTGSDSNNGTASTTPFATLEKAESVMETLGTAASRTYLEGGTHSRKQTLTLSNPNDQNKTWAAYPGQNPILDGGNSVAVGVSISRSGITIQGLTIKNFTTNGIRAYNGSNLTINSNIVLNTTTTCTWQTCGSADNILLWADANSTISNNYVSGSTGFGIVVGTVPGGGMIYGNHVFNTCTITSDCGAIYIAPANVGPAYTTTGYQVIGNVVGNFGSSQTNGIYLDNDTSNITVSANIVYGPGTWALMIHGGQKNVIQNNVFDITDTSYLGDYQDCVTSDNSDCIAAAAMSGNVFKDNIVYSSSPPPKTLWQYWNGSAAAIANPALSNNLYYDTRGTMPNTAPIIDSAPIYANPLFINAANQNYNLQAGSPALQLGFNPAQ